MKLYIFLGIIVQLQLLCLAEDYGRIEISMPNSKPDQPETYLCTSFELSQNETFYVTGFDANADGKVAHHMILYGCQSPGKLDPIFNCGAMASKQSGLSTAIHPCKTGPSIMFAWTQNAPKFRLPKDVGFRIGGPDSKIQWLVLQVHYANVDRIPKTGDTSGVFVDYSTLQRPKAAAVYWTVTSGKFPAGETTKSEAACKLASEVLIHPFAFRVHTHSLGRVVSGWKVSPDKTWSLIGKDDPQLPQMFRPVADSKMTLTSGDVVATRCTMVNTGTNDVFVGPTRDDEMCNFYIMYWVNGTEVPHDEPCFSPGPPYFSWKNQGALDNIPDQEASTYDE